VTELRNEGYLRARVLSSRVEFNDKRDKATIVLLLEEGRASARHMAECRARTAAIFLLKGPRSGWEARWNGFG